MFWIYCFGEFDNFSYKIINFIFHIFGCGRLLAFCIFSRRRFVAVDGVTVGGGLFLLLF